MYIIKYNYINCEKKESLMVKHFCLEITGLNLDIGVLFNIMSSQDLDRVKYRPEPY